MDVPALLSWYQERRRPLPWRTEVSPYRTLVSELMLQQTRVETVLPYFDRFMRQFPTVEALAAAPLEQVLERWAGLGYYSRARNLHRAALEVVARGGFPTDLAGLRALPGVGPYTAGAVASIALGLDAPLVDGNVERVFARWHAWEDPPGPLHRKAWVAAAAFLPSGRAGDYNQALMELGSTVCTPARAQCLLCPVSAGCRGRGAPERYPAPAPKAPVPALRAVALLDRREGAVLLARRPPEGLLGGLWEPPLAADPGADPAAVAASLSARLGAPVTARSPLPDVRHQFSHLSLTVTPWEGQVDGPLPASPPSPAPARTGRAPRDPGARLYVPYVDLCSLPLVELAEAALSTLARKVLRA